MAPTVAPSADDVAWLESLLPLLRELAPLQLLLLRDLPAGAEIEWSAAAPVPTHVVAASSSAAQDITQGWVLRLNERRRHAFALYLAVPQRVPASLPQLLLGAALCRLAWKLRHWSELDPPALRDETGDAIHALRNALNALVMTVAVLQEKLPAPQPLLEQLDHVTELSLQALDRLALSLFR